MMIRFGAAAVGVGVAAWAAPWSCLAMLLTVALCCRFFGFADYASTAAVNALLGPGSSFKVEGLWWGGCTHAEINIDNAIIAQLKRIELTFKRDESSWIPHFKLSVDTVVVSFDRTSAAAAAAAAAGKVSSLSTEDAAKDVGSSAYCGSTPPSPPAAEEEEEEEEEDSSLLMVQRILQHFEITVKRLETSVHFEPYSFVITLQQGLTLGPGRLPSLQEEEQQEFRSVLQARGGRDMFSTPNAAANGRDGGRSASSKAEAMPICAVLGSIDITLMKNTVRGDNGKPAPASLGGVTFTVGITFGLQLPSRLALNIFPAHLKVDFSRLPGLESLQAAWNAGTAPRKENGQAPQTKPTAAVATQVAAVFKLPRRTSFVCNGGVVEVVDQHLKQTAIVVIETCTAELQHFSVASTNPAHVQGLITARASVRGLTVSCMNTSSTAATKNLAIKSIAVEAKAGVARTADAANSWTVTAVDVSSAVEACHIVEDLDTDCGLNGWAKVFAAYTKATAHTDSSRAASIAAPSELVQSSHRAKLVHLVDKLPGGLSERRTAGVDVKMKVAVTDVVVCIVGIKEPKQSGVLQIGTSSLSYGRAANARGVLVTFEVGDLSTGLGVAANRQQGPHQTIEENEGLSLERLSVKVLLDPSDVSSRKQEEAEVARQRRRLRDVDVNVVVVGLHISTTPRLVQTVTYLKTKFASQFDLEQQQQQQEGQMLFVDPLLPAPPIEDGANGELFIDAKVQVLNVVLLALGSAASNQSSGTPAVQLAVDSWTGSMTRVQSPTKSSTPSSSLSSATSASAVPPPSSSSSSSASAAAPSRQGQERRELSVRTEAMSEVVRVRLAIGNAGAGSSNSGLRSLLHSTDSEFLFAPTINLKVDTSEYPESSRPGSTLCDLTVPELTVRWQLPSHVTAFSCATSFLSAMHSLPDHAGAESYMRRNAQPQPLPEVGDKQTAILCSAGIGVTTIHITVPPTRIVREQPPPGDPTESSPASTIVLKVSTTKSHLRKRWRSVDPSCCDEVLFSSALIIGKIDDAHILSVRQLQVRRVLTSDESDVVLPLAALCAKPPDLNSEQLDGSWWFEPITNVPNNTLFVDLRHLQLLLPHDRNTGMYFEQIQNTAKAVKAIHIVDTPGLPPSAEAILKPLNDVVALRVGSLEFTMEDDPFEVQLGQNYRLQAEEVEEQKHRERLLKAKIEAIAKSAPSGELDPAWIKSMFDLLGEASSSAYVQRATKLNSSEHPQPDLFALTARDLGLTFVPDARLLGAEGIAEAIHAVNKEAMHSTPMPKSTFTFARRVALSTRELKVTLRDYGNPLLLANNLSLNGLLILQSVLLAPAVEFICRRLVYLEGASKPVLRDGAPMKAYTALSLNVDALQNAWGPCLEPALQQLSINFDKLLTRGILIAPGNQVWMPWYDKVRQMRHGPVHIQAREWTTAILVSLDPHTEEDRIEIGINDLVARWYHGVLNLKGDVDVVIFPLTKFYACPVLSFAGLEVDANFEWLCKKGAQATACHHVDDMNDFKSLGFNLALNMRIHRKGPTSRGLCLLYANVITWLSRSFREVFTVARPKIKRGRLWRRFEAPRLNTFGQHMNSMKLDLSFPRATVLYFNAFDRSRGVHITSNELHFKANFDQPPEARRSSSPAGAGKGGESGGGTEPLAQTDYHPIPPELVCTSVDCEIAAVRATALKYAVEKKGRKKNADPRTTATAKRSDAAGTASDESDADESDGDYNDGGEHLNVEYLITDIAQAADEHSDRGVAVGCKKELLLTTTLIKVSRDHHRPDPRIRAHTASTLSPFDAGDARDVPRFQFPSDERVDASDFRSNSSPEISMSHRSSSSSGTPWTPHRRHSDAFGSDDDDDNNDGDGKAVPDSKFLYVVDFETFALVYTTFTADVFWSIWEKFRERRELKYDLSPEAVLGDTTDGGVGSGDEAVRAGEEKESGGLRRSGSGRGSRAGRGGTKRSSMLDRLLADAKSNFMGTSTLRTPVQKGGQDEVLEKNDVLEHFVRYRFSRPQIFNRGPETNMQLTVTVASIACDFRRHKLVWNKGRLECKESFTYRLDKMQWFAGPCLPTGYQWLPPDCAAADPDAECPENTTCVSPSTSVGYTSVLYFYDKAVAQMHDPKAVSHVRESTLSKDALNIDSFEYTLGELEIKTDPRESAGIFDVIQGLILEDFPLEESTVTEQEELDTLMFKSSLGGSTPSSEPPTASAAAAKSSSTELSAAQKEVLELQHAVRALKHGNDVLERSILANATDRSGSNRPESASETALRKSLEKDWSRNATLFRKARRDLKIRIKALLELRWSQQRGGAEVVRWNARNLSAVINDWTWTLLTAEKVPLLEIKIKQFRWAGNEENKATQAGTTEYEIQEVEVVDITPPDEAGGRASITASGGKRPPMLSRYRARGTVPDKHEPPMFRVYDKEAAPVGGISVTDHFEVNLMPLSVALTKYHVDKITEFLEVDLAEQEKGGSSAFSAVDDAPASRRPSTMLEADEDEMEEDAVDDCEDGEEYGAEESPVAPSRRNRGRPKAKEMSQIGLGSLLISTVESFEPSGSGATTMAAAATDDDDLPFDNVSASSISPHRARRRQDAVVLGSAGADKATEGPLHFAHKLTGSDGDLKSHRRSGSGGDINAGNGTAPRDLSPRLLRRSGLADVPPARFNTRRRNSFHGDISELRLKAAAAAAAAATAVAPISYGGQEPTTLAVEPAAAAAAAASSSSLQRRPSMKKGTRTRVLASISREAQVNEMKTRARSNQSFVYVKVPSFLICATYKGGNVVTDLTNLVVTLPVLEYHNRTLGWSALLEQIRSDCSGHVYSAFFKGKLLRIGAGSDLGSGPDVMPLNALSRATEEASPASLKAREAVLFGGDKEKVKRDKKKEKAEKKELKKAARAKMVKTGSQGSGLLTRLFSKRQTNDGDGEK